jgi:multidrug efflux pump subunit AcrB
MEKIWEFFINKRQFSLLLILGLVIFGLYSVFIIPKESAPEVQVPIAIVSTFFPGASADDVEKLVTNEMEDKIGGVENLKNLTSTSGEGLSVIVAEFDASADINDSIDLIKDAVDIAKPNLPREAEDPVVSEVSFSDQPVQLVSIASDLSAPEFIKLADKVQDELERVSGVSRVEKSGIRGREVQVVVNKEKLQSFGISLTDVISGISSANASLPIGVIRVEGVDYAVKFEGDIVDPSEIENIPILTKGGEPVYVRDVAFVSDGVAKASSFSRISIDGNASEQSVTLNVFKKSGGDITQTSRNVREKIAELENGILSESTVLISFDNGEFVEKDLKTLSMSALQTVLLVMIVLFIAIGWRESLIAGAAIPLSFLIAFIGLNASGNTINFVSLFSLILSVGILVDSAIVMVEGISSHTAEEGSRVKAAYRAIAEYHWPLTSGTMTTIAVFAPLFFISGVTGEFIASIPFTIIFVLGASLFVALAIIPIIAATVLSKKESSHMKQRQDAYAKKIRQWYRKQITKILGNRKRENIFLAGIVLLFIVTLSFPFIGLVDVIFFPQEDADFIIVEIEKVQGTALTETDLTVRAVEEILYTEPDIESFVTTTGAQSNFTGDGGSSGSRFGNVTITLREDRKKKSSEIVTLLRNETRGIRNTDIRISEPSDGPPTGAPIVVKLFGDDFDDLERSALMVSAVLDGVDGTANVRTTLETDGIDFVFTINREEAQRLGVTPSVIAQTLRTAVHGTTATTINTTDEDIDVVVSLNVNPDFTGPDDLGETTIDELRYIEIHTPNGVALLGSLADVEIRRANAVIRHEEQNRVVSVLSDLDVGFTARGVSQVFGKAIEDLEISEGVTLVIGGENEDVDQSFREMFFAFIAGVLVMLSILVLQFNSFRHALFIIVVVPFSLIGIMLGLAITGKALSFPSLMGLIALAGIVVNNAIIMIDRMNGLRKENKTMSLHDVVIEGAASRLRPILLTTLTTVIGIAPLIYASDLWNPLAISIMFGLSFSVVLTLVIVPLLYHRWPGAHVRSLYVGDFVAGAHSEGLGLKQETDKVPTVAYEEYEQAQALAKDTELDDILE